MDLAVRLSRAVESTSHKRVIFGCIAENHQFGIAHAHVIFGQLGSLAHHTAHQPTASILMPDLVEPMLTLEQTRSVSASARGMLSIKRTSPAEKPLCTKAP